MRQPQARAIAPPATPWLALLARSDDAKSPVGGLPLSVLDRNHGLRVGWPGADQVRAPRRYRRASSRRAGLGCRARAGDPETTRLRRCDRARNLGAVVDDRKSHRSYEGERP